MNKNSITPELLEERMKAAGFGEDVSNDDERIMDLVLDYYNVELTDDWERDLGYYIYTESTRDGNEVYVATPDPNHICINDDVYYYDHDLVGALCEGIKNSNGDGKIYIGDLAENYVMEAMQLLYKSIYDTTVANVTDELIDEGYEE